MMRSIRAIVLVNNGTPKAVMSALCQKVTFALLETVPLFDDPVCSGEIGTTIPLLLEK
jgi:hypothetical protein